MLFLQGSRHKMVHSKFSNPPVSYLPSHFGIKSDYISNLGKGAKVNFNHILYQSSFIKQSKHGHLLSYWTEFIIVWILNILAFDCKFVESFFYFYFVDNYWLRTLGALAQELDIYQETNVNGLFNLHNHQLIRFWLIQRCLCSNCHLQSDYLS